MDESFKVGEGVLLVHPARFLFNAGTTPKAWNKKMLEDRHFKVLFYEEVSQKVFTNAEIKGGIAITYHDSNATFEPIGTFTKFMELNAILQKTRKIMGSKTMEPKVVTRTAYHFTDKMHEDHPEAIAQLSRGHAYDVSTNVFERVPQLFFDVEPKDGHVYIRMLGREDNHRVYKYIRKEYIRSIPSLSKYKLFMPSASGNGTFGEALTMPVLEPPYVGATETFISIGGFETEEEAKAALEYVRTKFCRALLGVLKVTQHLTPQKWKYVPLQDFTSASDIDWSQPTSDIDRQLYEKYGLDDDEVAFIESHVKEMS